MSSSMSVLLYVVPERVNSTVDICSLVQGETPLPI